MASDALERALTLIARMHGGDAVRAAQAREELAAWRGAAPGHEAAFREADRRWQAVGGFAADLRGTVPEPGNTRHAGKAVAKAGLLLGLLFAVGLLLRVHLAQPLYEQPFATAVAQTANLELPDGSKIALDARTSLQVAFFRGKRQLRFGGGEAYFDIAPDAARPFIIETRMGRVSVLGTAFTIRDRGGAVTVTVERGRVEVLPSSAPDSPVELIAGLRVTIADGHAGPPQAAPPQIAPWRKGWLIFDDMPLAEVLQSVSAYCRTPVSPADARAAGLRLTGSFRLREAEAIPDVLPRVLPVEVRRGADGSASIASRP